MFKAVPRILCAASLALWLGACAKEEAHDHDHDHEHADHSHESEVAATAADQLAGSIEDAAAKTATDDAYPLDVCVVSGEELGSMGDPVNFVHEGVAMKLCCDHCLPKLKKDPAKYAAKVTAALAGPDK